MGVYGDRGVFGYLLQKVGYLQVFDLDHLDVSIHVVSVIGSKSGRYYHGGVQGGGKLAEIGQKTNLHITVRIVGGVVYDEIEVH